MMPELDNIEIKTWFIGSRDRNFN